MRRSTDRIVTSHTGSLPRPDAVTAMLDLVGRVLVGGETPVNALTALGAQLQASGFAKVSLLSGPPPAFEQPAAQSAA